VTSSNGCTSCERCLALIDHQEIGEVQNVELQETGNEKNSAVVGVMGGQDYTGMASELLCRPTPQIGLTVPASRSERIVVNTPGSLIRQQMVRLDCDPEHESTMPHFTDVLSLIDDCVQRGRLFKLWLNRIALKSKKSSYNCFIFLIHDKIDHAVFDCILKQCFPNIMFLLSLNSF